MAFLRASWDFVKVCAIWSRSSWVVMDKDGNGLCGPRLQRWGTSDLGSLINVNEKDQKPGLAQRVQKLEWEKTQDLFILLFSAQRWQWRCVVSGGLL